jgi:hypothetical protein
MCAKIGNKRVREECAKIAISNIYVNQCIVRTRIDIAVISLRFPTKLGRYQRFSAMRSRVDFTNLERCWMDFNTNDLEAVTAETKRTLVDRKCKLRAKDYNLNYMKS